MDRDAGAGPAAEEDERERLAAEEAGELPACEVNKGTTPRHTWLQRACFSPACFVPTSKSGFLCRMWIA